MARHAADLPDAEVVHRIHDRYLTEIVEDLGLCPFARKSREQGRVHRPLLFGSAKGARSMRPTAGEAAERLHDTVTQHADAEIVLLTFVVPAGHRMDDPRTFEAFVTNVRAAYGESGGPRFFMVGFHPDLEQTMDGDRPVNADSLVPLLRRSPDPVIQCVNAAVLERVRAEARQAARARFEQDLLDYDPALASVLENSVQADSALSSDIARHNFDAVGVGGGREELERRVADIRRARDEAYGRKR